MEKNEHDIEVWSRDDLRSALGEGFHTAFRKAVDGHGSAEIHYAITKMPRKVWGDVLDFVLAGLPQERFIVEKSRRKTKST
jgi:hypothetical protein